MRGWFVRFVVNELCDCIHYEVNVDHFSMMEMIELRRDLLDCINLGVIRPSWGYKRLRLFLDENVNYSMRKIRFIEKCLL